jgi:hypothetical protein
MRTAETLLGRLQERGRQRLPLERVYRWLFNPALSLMAAGSIDRNAGAMTPGKHQSNRGWDVAGEDRGPH